MGFSLANAFLLLGAGASADAQVPTAYQFVGKIRDYLATLPSETSGPLLSEFDNIVETIKLSSGNEPGLEPFYEAIDDCLDAHFTGSQPPNGLIASRAIERIHYETKRVIQQQCDVRQIGRVAYLSPLLEHLRKFRPFPIVSFNYDSVVEAACSALGLTYAEAVLGEDIARCDIELVKVHGSVTWLPDKKGRALHRNSEYGSAIMRQRGELRSPTLEMPMIYPSRRKMPIHEPFMRNALRLQKLLQTKETCIAVGYSFPDAHVRAWLADAIGIRPDLAICLIGPNPEVRAVDNLTSNLPTVAWTKCLRLVRKRFGDVIAEGFQANLDRAESYGARTLVPGAGKCVRHTSTVYSTVRASGIGAAPDGSALYVSENARTGRLLRIDLETNKQSVFATNLKNPRGVAVKANGCVLVVQNRLFRSKWIPSTGAGAVVEISADGRHRKVVNRPRYREMLDLAIKLRGGTPWSDLRDKLQAVLSWPTDIACGKDGTIFVTEARALVRIDAAARLPQCICRPELAFNLHGIDVASDGAVVGVEQGVGQAFGWGRVLRFEISQGGCLCSTSTTAEGRSRLMGICFVPPLNKVIVTQALTWPYGGLLALDYPTLNNPKFVGGFDFPQKVEYVPKRELLAIGTLRGLEIVAISKLERQIAVAVA